jgi:cytochrome P450
MTLTVPSLPIDLFTDENLTDPYPLYEQIRAAGPVVWLEATNCWAVARYEDVRGVLSDWETFTSEQGVGLNDAINAQLQGTLLASSPPLHDTLRGVLSEPLSPRGMRKMTMDIKQRARDIIEPLIAAGRFDAVADLARVFPPTIVADLVGIPEEVRHNLIPWADAIFNLMGPPDKERTYAKAALVGEQFAWLATVKPTDLAEGSWGRAIYAAAEEGRIPQEDAPKLLAAYTSAAMDTTINALGSALLLFSENPDQWSRLREDRSLIPAAFNEVLRFESPLQYFSRAATKDVEIQGTLIRKGDRVMVIFASANRDDRHFGETADRFDITRDASDHLSFGYGIHGCIGQGLARMEAHSVFDVLADHVERFRLIEPPVRHLNSAIRGLESLRVSVV